MRFRWLVTIMGIAIANSAPAQEVLTATRLEELANRARAFHPKDEFDTAYGLPSVSGKRFVYTVEPARMDPDKRTCKGFPIWAYLPQKDQLEVGLNKWSESSTILSGSRSATGSKTYATFDTFVCKKVSLPSALVTQELATKTVVRETITAIGDLSDPYTGWKTYWITKASGDEARQLSKALRIRVSGSLVDWKPSQPVLCGIRASVSTRESAQGDTLDLCMFKGKADLFEVLHTRTGAILFASPRR